VISAVGGTTGFLAGLVGLYALSHIRVYLKGLRSFPADVASLTHATLRGALAMYAFRIPCQFLLQRLGVTPALAALVSQGLAGVVATVIRARHNYRASIFGS
jgi:hypothetical protein